MARIKRDARFGHDDEAAFTRAKQWLLDGFGAELERQGWERDLFVPSLMLTYKWAHAGGAILQWRIADLDGFLFDFLPRRATLDAEDIDRVPVQVVAFLAWLEGQGIRGGDPFERLQDWVIAAAGAFIDTMTKGGGGGFASNLVRQMQAEGVDPADPAALERWMADFNSRTLAERDAILGFPASHEDADAPLAVEMRGPIPVIELAPDAELEVAAGASDVLRRLGIVARFAATPRRLTRNGNLTLADGKALAAELGLADRFDPVYHGRVYATRSTDDITPLRLLLRWAREAGFVKIRSGVLSVTEKGRRMGSAPLADWDLAHRAFVSGKVLPAIETRRYFTFENEPVAQLLEILPGWLYRKGELPLREVRQAAALLLEDLYDLPPPSDAVDHRRWVGNAAERRLLEPLRDLGAITFDEQSVRLTPLGWWGTNRWLREEGWEAPVIGELVGATAAELIRACANLELADAERELRRWIEARAGAPDAAARELASVARAADGLELLALHALGMLPGEVAEPLVRELAGVPVLRGKALLWLVGHGFESEETLSAPLLQSMLIETLADELDSGGPKALVARLVELGPEAEQLRFIESCVGAEHPGTAELLNAIGVAHPSKAVAKAARTTAFKRTGRRLD